MDLKLFLQLAGIALGLLYLWLEYRADIRLWIVGLIMPLVHGALYYRAGLYADCSMQVYYVLAGLYGWLVWRRARGGAASGGNAAPGGDAAPGSAQRDAAVARSRGNAATGGAQKDGAPGSAQRDVAVASSRGDAATGEAPGGNASSGGAREKAASDGVSGGNAATNGSRGPKKAAAIGHTPLRFVPALVGVYAAAHGAIYLLLVHFTNSTVPFWDAMTTAASAVAMWMLSRKYIEQWLVWLVVDLITVGLYLYKDIPWTGGLYALYSVLAVAGYLRWRRMAAAQRGNAG